MFSVVSLLTFYAHQFAAKQDMGAEKNPLNLHEKYAPHSPKIKDPKVPLTRFVIIFACQLMNQRVDDQKYVHSAAPFPLPRWGWPRSLPDVTEGRGSGHRISANGALLLAPRWSSCCWSLFSEAASPSPLTKSKVIAFDYGARWSDDGAELDHPALSPPLPYSLCMWVLVVYPTGEWAPLMLCVCEHFSRWTLSRWMCRICGGEEMREKIGGFVIKLEQR